MQYRVGKQEVHVKVLVIKWVYLLKKYGLYKPMNKVGLGTESRGTNEYNTCSN